MAENEHIDRDLAARLVRALAASPDELFSVLQDHSIEVITAALRNPAVTGNHLLALLDRKELPTEICKLLFEQKRFADDYKVAFALACHPATPANISLTLLNRIYLFDLLKICLAPRISADLRTAAERTVIKRLPAEPLGNRITLARRGNTAIVEALIRDGEHSVIEACLDNPHLKEGSVYQFINSGKATAETISMVGRHHRWKGRPGIQLAILKNPRTPAVWYTVFLPALTIPVMRELAGNKRLATEIRAMIMAAIKKRGC